MSDKKPKQITTTEDLKQDERNANKGTDRGLFKESPEARAEFLSLCK
uniref:Uncharacterized protein n=1 Tax=viral metagenome TaxID=1070528 RepID=A0A6M3IVE3_9ZZZZ